MNETTTIWLELARADKKKSKKARVA